VARHRLDIPDPSDISAEFKGRTRFLIDESLGCEVANYLREKGFNAVYVGYVGLSGHADVHIFVYAWPSYRFYEKVSAN
jgi:hypothetical protein